MQGEYLERKKQQLPTALSCIKYIFCEMQPTLMSAAANYSASESLISSNCPSSFLRRKSFEPSFLQKSLVLSYQGCAAALPSHPKKAFEFVSQSQKRFPGIFNEWTIQATHFLTIRFLSHEACGRRTMNDCFAGGGGFFQTKPRAWLLSDRASESSPW